MFEILTKNENTLFFFSTKTKKRSLKAFEKVCFSPQTFDLDVHFTHESFLLKLHFFVRSFPVFRWLCRYEGALSFKKYRTQQEYANIPPKYKIFVTKDNHINLVRTIHSHFYCFFFFFVFFVILKMESDVHK